MTTSEQNQTARRQADPEVERDRRIVLKGVSYQRLVLPGGIETEGEDRSATADKILDFDLKGKAVLDVGCKYGFYCLEAKKRGAGKVVGVEKRRKVIEVLQSVHRLSGMEDLSFVKAKFPSKSIGPRKFDVVMLLNMVHHQPDIKKASALIMAGVKATRERLILCMPPPLAEGPKDANRYKRIDWMVSTEQVTDQETGKRRIRVVTLISARYLKELLSPYFREFETMDAPDYPGRYILIAKK